MSGLGSGWEVGVALTVSKSMDVNLKRRRKKGGIRMLLLRRVEDILGGAKRSEDRVRSDPFVLGRCLFVLGSSPRLPSTWESLAWGNVWRVFFS